MVRFEWDESKSRRNQIVHGVSFREGQTAFDDPLGRIADDPRHSREENRHALLALSGRGRLVVVIFTEGNDRIRLISARRATSTERRQYEETAQ